MAAKDNEKAFKKLFEEAFGRDVLLPGKEYKDPVTDVIISVDNTIDTNDLRVLIEIDSGNYAKLLVGQYMLLNKLYPNDKRTLFLIIHAYKKYNTTRTIKNLRYVNEHYLNNNGLIFCVIHLDEFNQLVIRKDIEVFLESIEELSISQMS